MPCPHSHKEKKRREKGRYTSFPLRKALKKKEENPKTSNLIATFLKKKGEGKGS